MNRSKWIALLLAAVMMFSLCACTSAQPSEEEETSSVSLDAELGLPEGTLDTDGDEYADTFYSDAAQELQIALGNCVNWPDSEEGDLMGILAATSLMTWSNSSSLKDADPSQIRGILDKYFEALDADSQTELRENWSTVSDDADRILSGDSGISGDVESAGCTEIVAQLQSNESSADNWAAFKSTMDSYLAE